MTEVTQVIRWQTSDGREFDEEPTAITHQRKLELSVEFETKIGRHGLKSFDDLISNMRRYQRLFRDILLYIDTTEAS